MAGPRVSWPLTRLNSESTYERQSRYYRDEKRDPDVEINDLSTISSRSESSQIVGSADMFDENGNIRLIPVRPLSRHHT